MGVQTGSVKTTKLCMLVKDAKNTLVLAFTNKAVKNVKCGLIKIGIEKEEVNKTCHTFDSYFFQMEQSDNR